MLLAHLAATWAMVGLIWLVQVVHYPLFAHVGESAFVEYERRHQARITWVVAPLMLVELLLAVGLVARPAPHAPRWVAWLGLGLLGVAWLSTFLIQVPLHERLARGFDATAHRWLVDSNWLRTSAWTLRGALALYLARALLSAR